MRLLDEEEDEFLSAVEQTVASDDTHGHLKRLKRKSEAGDESNSRAAITLDSPPSSPLRSPSAYERRKQFQEKVCLFRGFS